MTVEAVVSNISCFLCTDVLNYKEFAWLEYHLRLEHKVTLNIKFLMAASRISEDEVEAITGIINRREKSPEDINVNEPKEEPTPNKEPSTSVDPTVSEGPTFNARQLIQGTPTSPPPSSKDSFPIPESDTMVSVKIERNVDPEPEKTVTDNKLPDMSNILSIKKELNIETGPTSNEEKDNVSNNEYRSNYVCEALDEKKNVNQTIRSSFDCPICHKSLTKRSSLRKHTMNVHKLSILNVCHVCGKKPEGTSMKEHLKTEHNVQMRVRFSDGDQTNEVADKEAKEVSNSPNSIEKQIACPTCVLVFPSQRVLFSHIKVVHGTDASKCLHCEKVFVSREQYRHHLNKSHNMKIHKMCHICNKQFDSRFQLKSHLAEVHKRTSPLNQLLKGNNKYKEVMDKILSTDENKEIEDKDTNPMDESTEEGNTDNKKTTWHGVLSETCKCDQCGLKMRFGSYKRHLRKVHKTKEETIASIYQTTLAKLKSSSNNLNTEVVDDSNKNLENTKEVATIETMDKTRKCVKCGAKMKLSTYRRHLRKVHKYSETEINDLYNSKVVNTVTSNKDAKFKCGRCEMTLGAMSYKRHLRKQHSCSENEITELYKSKVPITTTNETFDLKVGLSTSSSLSITKVKSSKSSKNVEPNKPKGSSSPISSGNYDSSLTVTVSKTVGPSNSLSGKNVDSTILSKKIEDSNGTSEENTENLPAKMKPLFIKMENVHYESSSENVEVESKSETGNGDTLDKTKQVKLKCEKCSFFCFKEDILNVHKTHKHPSEKKPQHLDGKKRKRTGAGPINIKLETDSELTEDNNTDKKGKIDSHQDGNESKLKIHSSNSKESDIAEGEHLTEESAQHSDDKKLKRLNASTINIKSEKEYEFSEAEVNAEKKGKIDEPKDENGTKTNNNVPVPKESKISNIKQILKEIEERDEPESDSESNEDTTSESPTIDPRTEHDKFIEEASSDEHEMTKKSMFQEVDTVENYPHEEDQHQVTKSINKENKKTDNSDKQHCDLCKFSCFKEEFMKIHMLHKHNVPSGCSDDPLNKLIEEAYDDGSKKAPQAVKKSVNMKEELSIKSKEEVYISNIKSKLMNVLQDSDDEVEDETEELLDDNEENSLETLSEADPLAI